MPTIIFFLTLAILILFGSHYFLYLSLVHFFSISQNISKIFLSSALFLLSISFIIASIFSRLRENWFTRSYYFLSGAWLGILTNIIMALAIVWLIILAARFFNFNISLSFLGTIFLILAMGYSLYGISNALKPKIKNISVEIKNLPSSWQGKKIIQISDVHLGSVNRQNFLIKIVEKINAENPELVVITGDFFDSMDGDLKDLANPLKKIKAPDGIFFVTGNHETYLGINEILPAINDSRINFLDDRVVNVNGLRFIGLSYPKQGDKKNIPESLGKLKKEYEGYPSILLYHSPENIEEVKNLGISLELCGHTHKGQFFPFGYITNLVYKGYDYGLHEFGNFTLYTSSGTGTWGPTMRTGSQSEIVSITLR